MKVHVDDVVKEKSGAKMSPQACQEIRILHTSDLCKSYFNMKSLVILLGVKYAREILYALLWVELSVLEECGYGLVVREKGGMHKFAGEGSII